MIIIWKKKLYPKNIFHHNPSFGKMFIVQCFLKCVFDIFTLLMGNHELGQKKFTPCLRWCNVQDQRSLQKLPFYKARQLHNFGSFILAIPQKYFEIVYRDQQFHVVHFGFVKKKIVVWTP
jgi:hypothetical protein